MGLIFKHALKLCDEACSCKAFFITFIICSVVARQRINADLDGLFYLTTIRIKIRTRMGPFPTPG
jgi:hypothetical protein